jgi:ribulose-5-phosphate 4-epimerase/fuculose-1-phosphate aldolase
MAASPVPVPLDTVTAEPELHDPEAVRLHRRERLALAYRMWGRLGWGSLGDGHITARDPLRTDHFWLGRYGVPFGRMTVDDLVLVGPGPVVVGGSTNWINPAAYNIHFPIHEARPDIVAAAHTHTPYGTPFAATLEPVRAISQEACAFVGDTALFDDEELDIVSPAGGERIARALGASKAVILRNHGTLTVGATVDEAVGWFSLFERAAEVHVKAGPRAQAISEVGAKEVARTVGTPEAAWHAFQWLVRSHLGYGLTPADA